MQEKDEKFNNYFMDVAIRTAQNSYANRAKVGAVLVKDNHIVATGWNGRVSGVCNDCEELIDTKCLNKLNLKEVNNLNSHELYKTRADVVHAEVNLIYFCAKNGLKTDGTILYNTLSPCATCALAIIQAGIKKVFYNEQYHDITGLNILKDAGVEIEELKCQRK